MSDALKNRKEVMLTNLDIPGPAAGCYRAEPISTPVFWDFFPAFVRFVDLRVVCAAGAVLKQRLQLAPSLILRQYKAQYNRLYGAEPRCKDAGARQGSEQASSACTALGVSR